MTRRKSCHDHTMVRGLVKKSREAKHACITASILHRTEQNRTEQNSLNDHAPRHEDEPHHTVSDQAPQIPVLGQLLQRALNASKLRLKSGPLRVQSRPRCCNATDEQTLIAATTSDGDRHSKTGVDTRRVWAPWRTLAAKPYLYMAAAAHAASVCESLRPLY